MNLDPFYEKCIICYDTQIKILLRRPCYSCRNIYFCSFCLHEYIECGNKHCCQCRKSIDLDYVFRHIKIDYIMMLMNISVFYLTPLKNLTLVANYLLCSSMLLRLLHIDVRLADYFSIFLNIVIMITCNFTPIYILEFTYLIYLTVYIVEKL